MHISKETIEVVTNFTKDRNWEQFHTPANLAKSISIEANELLELFQWSDTDYNIDALKEELADVFAYCINMADVLQLDPNEIIQDKFKKNAKKYPIEKAYNSSKKYNEF